jgi:hypothetical protein
MGIFIPTFAPCGKMAKNQRESTALEKVKRESSELANP